MPFRGFDELRGMARLVTDAAALMRGGHKGDRDGKGVAGGISQCHTKDMPTDNGCFSQSLPFPVTLLP